MQEELKRERAINEGHRQMGRIPEGTDNPWGIVKRTVGGSPEGVNKATQLEEQLQEAKRALLEERTAKELALRVLDKLRTVQSSPIQSSMLAASQGQGTHAVDQGNGHSASVIRPDMCTCERPRGRDFRPQGQA